MASKGVKRTAAKASSEEPGAKRVADFLKQHGVSKASFKPVLEAVEHPLANLSEGARKMLLATLPWSLAVPVDQRHEAQEGVVGMVDGVVKAVHAQLQEQVASQANQVDELEGSKSTLLGEAEHAEGVVVEAGKVEEECKDRLSEVETALAAKQAAVKTTELEVKRMESELEDTRSLAAQIKEVLSGSFASLKEGAFEDAEVESMVEKVMTMVKRSSMEESLVATLPPCLGKRERGSFDEVVIGQAEEGLHSKVAALEEVASQSEEQLSAQKAAAQAACAELVAAQAVQTQAVDELHSTQEASKVALEKAVEAKRAVSDLEAKLAEAKLHLDAKRSESEAFRSYNMSIFEHLRDQTTNKPNVEATIEEPSTQSIEHTEEVAAEQAADALALSEEPAAKITEQIGKDVVASMAGAAGA